MARPRSGRRSALGQLVTVQVVDAAGKQVERTMPRAEAIVLAIMAGCTHEAAAEMNGTPRATFFSWMARGRSDAAANMRSPYRDFLDAVTRATARSEFGLLSEIRRICKERGDARTLLELLGRRFPSRWGRVERIEVTGADGEPLIPALVSDRVVIEAASEIKERALAAPVDVAPARE